MRLDKDATARCQKQYRIDARQQIYEGQKDLKKRRKTFVWKLKESKGLMGANSNDQHLL